MEARILRCSLILISLFCSTGAVYQTRNFKVTAPTADEAKRVGEAAEEYRRDLAIFWLGRPLPPWGKACKIRVKTGALGAGGETRFQFIGKEVVNWNMFVQGSLERILDSVLPHEVNHTIFACHYRRPLPRWADEGAATLFEHRSEQLKQLGLLNQVIKSDREFIPLERLLTMAEYPKGYRPMLILYAEGYALADFLVQQGGRQRYLKFLSDGHRVGWSQAIRSNYSHGGVKALEKNWKSWIVAGMPRLYVPEGIDVASVNEVVSKVQGASRPAILDLYDIRPTVRLQSPDSGQRRIERMSARNTPPAASRQPRTAPTRGAVSSSGPSPGSMVSRQSQIGRPRTEAPQPRRSPRSSSAPTSRPKAGSSAGHSIGGMNSRSSETRNEASRASSSTATSASTPNRGGRSRFSRPVKSSRYESTGMAGRRPLNPTQRKHLSRERHVVTGSIPQWAGFPGQKELF